MGKSAVYRKVEDCMSERYYVHDLEADRLHIHTGGKADWMTLPEADRSAIKSACLWSNHRGCWISRTKGGKARFWRLEVLERNGFEDRGEQGERLSFADQVTAKQERAESRAERLEDRADNASSESDDLYKRAHTMASAIPMGQPILVGHHSEKRDRNYREKIHNTFRRAFQADDKAKHYARRAEIARATAEGSQYSNPSYLDNRIRECEADLRKIAHRLEGKFYHYSTPEPVSEEYRARLLEWQAETEDKLGFYRHCWETCGRVVFSRETLKGKQAVKIRGRWEPIVRLNPTTVAVPNICFPLEADQRKYALKYSYAEVQEAK